MIKFLNIAILPFKEVRRLNREIRRLRSQVELREVIISLQDDLHDDFIIEAEQRGMSKVIEAMEELADLDKEPTEMNNDPKKDVSDSPVLTEEELAMYRPDEPE